MNFKTFQELFGEDLDAGIKEETSEFSEVSSNNNSTHGGARDAKGRSYVAPEPDYSIEAPRPGGKFYGAIKRSFDVVFSFFVCVILAIPVALACLIIRIDTPGVPIFKQERVGLNGNLIYIYKLRTMVKDAHENPEKYLTEEQLKQWDREQKVDDDPRITRVGSFLRRLSLDELPQFLNVLRGDLSVIGPRPVTQKETQEYGTARDLILSLKPGITGWWQVTARNDATWENGERQEYELFYARHASLGLDLRIFARTFKAMSEGK